MFSSPALNPYLWRAGTDGSCVSSLECCPKAFVVAGGLDCNLRHCCVRIVEGMATWSALLCTVRKHLAFSFEHVHLFLTRNAAKCVAVPNLWSMGEAYQSHGWSETLCCERDHIVIFAPLGIILGYSVPGNLDGHTKQKK